MTIGERIRAVRTAAGMTQEELGKKCGIDGANIRKYENGKQNPKLETIRKIAKALNVDWLDLTSENTEENPTLPFSVDVDAIYRAIGTLSHECLSAHGSNSIEVLENMLKTEEFYEWLDSIRHYTTTKANYLLQKNPNGVHALKLSSTDDEFWLVQLKTKQLVDKLAQKEYELLTLAYLKQDTSEE